MLKGTHLKKLVTDKLVIFYFNTLSNIECYTCSMHVYIYLNKLHMMYKRLTGHISEHPLT